MSKLLNKITLSLVLNNIKLNKIKMPNVEFIDTQRGGK
jgi:hypothetical protein